MKKGNYKLVAILTAASKLFEIVVLENVDEYLVFCDNQFGFKIKHSTELCIYALISVVQYYNDHNSPVNKCFLALNEFN